jgi:arylsulfatase
MRKPPNILFIFSDQQHWEAAGFVDASFSTPALDALARQGTVFTRAFCTTPQCSPSRSSLLTGFYPSRTGVLGNVGAAGGAPLAMPTIGATLRDAGYRTAYFGKWHLGKMPVATSGWDEDAGVTGPELRRDPEVTRRALEFLSRPQDADRPFALFLSYNNPHEVYRFGAERHPAPREPGGVLPPTWQRKDLSAAPAVQRQFMEEDQGRIMRGADEAAWLRYREVYREKVACYDADVGRVLHALDAHGFASDTLVVATSDHGDMDAQHRLIFKGPFMYEHMMRVPLLVRWPGRPAGTCDFPTVNVDLVPTLCEAAGLPAPASDGVSLKPFLTGGAATPRRDAVVGQYYSKQRWVNPIRMIRTARWKYNVYRVHGEELYDLENDPMELENRAVDPALAGTKADLAAELAAWMRAHDDPFEAQRPTRRDGSRLTEADGVPA